MPQPENEGIRYSIPQEHTPGVWAMVDSIGRKYGTVPIVREACSVVYVGETRGGRLGGQAS